MSQVAPDTHQIDDEARPGAWAADTSLDVIEVVGSDAVGYLQGQLSQNVSGLAVGAWAPSLLLDAVLQFDLHPQWRCFNFLDFQHLGHIARTGRIFDFDAQIIGNLIGTFGRNISGKTSHRKIQG